MKNEKILVTAAREYLQQGRTAEAQALVGAWQQRVPGAATPLALQVLLELTAGRLEHARALAAQAVARDTGCALAYFSLTQVHLADERTDDALTCAQRAHSLAPDDVEVLRLLAQLRLQAGAARLAETLLRSALMIDGQDAKTKLMLGELLLNQPDGDIVEGERLTREVCQAAPHISTAWALHGLLLLRMNQATLAAEQLELALQLEPDQPAYLLSLAQLLVDAEAATPAALERAATHARRVVALAPQNWRGAALLARILRRQRQATEALRVLNHAGKASPEQVELILELAQACVDAGQISAALDAVRRAEALSPSVHALPIHTLRAALYWRQGRLQEAGAAFDAADLLERAGEQRLQAPLQTEQVQGKVVSLFASSVTQCLLMARYSAALAAHGARVVMMAPPWLAPLLVRVPGLESVSSNNAHTTHWIEPMLRLPFLLSQEQPVFEAPYLSPDAAVLERVRAIRATHAGPCILLDLADITDLSLLEQLGRWLLQRQVLVLLLSPVAGWHDMGLASRPMELEDIESITAWVALADAVVSGDQPLAHLAGGMGVAAQVLLPQGYDAMWGPRAASTPWYPALRLHHEPLQGHWIEAWAALDAALTAQLAQLEPVA